MTEIGNVPTLLVNNLIHNQPHPKLTMHNAIHMKAYIQKNLGKYMHPNLPNK